jgi:uncharacterized protein (TIGR03435 family)
VVLVAGVLAVADARGQGGSETIPLGFDVASITPRTGPRQPPGLLSPGRYTNQDATLLNLIAFAYELSPAQIAGGPEWVRVSRFAVNAVATGTPSMAELRQMVQRLLMDRFRLRTRVELRDMLVFSLEVDRADRTLGSAITPSSAPRSIRSPSAVQAARRSLRATIGT